MKRILICTVIVFIVIFQGCSLFNKSAIQPGKKVVQRPGSSETKPGPGEPCKFSIVQKTDVYPIIKEHPAGDDYFYEDEIINPSNTKSMNFTITILEGIKSIEPNSFLLKPGESKVIKIQFGSQTNQFTSDTVFGKEIKHGYKITSDCNNESKEIIFYTTLIAPYTYSLYYPTNPLTELKKNPDFTYVYKYKIINQSKYYREIRILNSKYQAFNNAVGLPPKGTRYIDYRFSFSENAEANKLYTFVFYFDFGYTESNWGGSSFVSLIKPQKVEFTIKAID